MSFSKESPIEAWQFFEFFIKHFSCCQYVSFIFFGFSSATANTFSSSIHRGNWCYMEDRSEEFNQGGLSALQDYLNQDCGRYLLQKNLTMVEFSSLKTFELKLDVPSSLWIQQKKLPRSKLLFSSLQSKCQNTNKKAQQSEGFASQELVLAVETMLFWKYNYFQCYFSPGQRQPAQVLSQDRIYWVYGPGQGLRGDLIASLNSAHESSFYSTKTAYKKGLRLICSYFSNSSNICAICLDFNIFLNFYEFFPTNSLTPFLFFGNLVLEVSKSICLPTKTPNSRTPKAFVKQTQIPSFYKFLTLKKGRTSLNSLSYTSSSNCNNLAPTKEKTFTLTSCERGSMRTVLKVGTIKADPSNRKKWFTRFTIRVLARPKVLSVLSQTI